MTSENSPIVPLPLVASQVLRTRMQTLAQPLLEDEARDSLEIVVFSLGDAPTGEEANTEKPNAPVAGQYAFETAQVREVFPVPDATQIARLPGTPPWVRGILNVRGRILTVLDLQHLFGLPEHEAVSGAPVLILRGEVTAETAAETGGEAGVSAADAIVQASDVALATNGVTSVHMLPRAQLETGHALEGTPGARYLRGLTQDGIALLDAALLLSDVQLVVQAE
jgi:purine-binding chemotaxis protein CheW